MKNSIKYKSRISTLFLYAYLSFTVLSTLHCHSYSLFNEQRFHVNSGSNLAGDHFLSGNFSICAINHFSGTILDYKFSSNNLSPYLSHAQEFILIDSDRLTSSYFLAKNSPRAPPVFS